MNLDAPPTYPGQHATPGDLLRLAGAYRAASSELRRLGRRGSTLSRAPYRMVTIHAIELYLNAFLLARGYPPARIRGLQHDLGARMELAAGARLALRRRTLDHLQSISQSREYLLTRYDPGFARVSEINRLEATLAEIATKVVAALVKATEDAPAKEFCPSSA